MAKAKQVSAEVKALKNESDARAKVSCPFTRRDEFRTLQAPVDKLTAWLEAIGTLHTVRIDVDKVFHNDETRMNEDETDIIQKTWTNTTYKVVSEGGLELNLQTLRNAATIAARRGYRFINVDIAKNIVTFKA